MSSWWRRVFARPEQQPEAPVTEPPLHEEFGALREALAEQDADALVSVLRAAHREAPRRYREEWRPFLAGHSLPVIRYRMRRFDELAVLLPPNGRVSLEAKGDPESSLRRLGRHEARGMICGLQLVLCKYPAPVLDAFLKKLPPDSLESLTFMACALTDAHIKAICAAPSCAGLQRLRVSANNPGHLTSESVRMISRAPMVHTARWIELAGDLSETSLMGLQEAVRRAGRAGEGWPELVFNAQVLGEDGLRERFADASVSAGESAPGPDGWALDDL